MFLGRSVFPIHPQMTLKRKDNVDRHSPRPLVNNHQLAEPTCFLNFFLIVHYL
jgi:hypothetical protein